MKKYINNPFKIWGSYIGFLVGMGFGIIRFTQSQSVITGCMITGGCETLYRSPGYLPVFIYGTVGFIIGWLVHTLLKDIKSKK
jgi:hypothetical protein